MGIFKHLFGKSKNEVETGETISLNYDDELRQIYDNYCHGFLRLIQIVYMIRHIKTNK